MRVNSGDTTASRFVLIFCDGGAALADFSHFYENVTNVNFLSMAIKNLLSQSLIVFDRILK